MKFTLLSVGFLAFSLSAVSLVISIVALLSSLLSAFLQRDGLLHKRSFFLPTHESLWFPFIAQLPTESPQSWTNFSFYPHRNFQWRNFNANGGFVFIAFHRQWRVVRFGCLSYIPSCCLSCSSVEILREVQIMISRYQSRFLWFQQNLIYKWNERNKTKDKWVVFTLNNDNFGMMKQVLSAFHPEELLSVRTVQKRLSF